MHDLTTGSITRHLLKTTGFMLVTMVFQTLYFLVDLYWVGRLGKEAVAAVAIAGNLTFIVLAITQMLAVGTTTVISHAVGRKDHTRAQLVFNQSQVLAAVAGAAFFAIAMLLRQAYAATLGADPTTVKLAGDYLLWFIPAMALQFAIAAMAAALRGTGNFKPGMIVQTFTVLVNIVLAPFLVFGWFTQHPMGVAGAAIASLVAVVIGTVWLATYFRSTEAFLHFRRTLWKPKFDLWWQMLSVGLPAGAEFALMAVYLFVIYTLTRPFGSAAQAGFGIGLRIVQAGFMPVVALGFSVAPVAGQNFGARLAARVKDAFKAAAGMAAAVMVALAVLCHLVPESLIGVFADDPRVITVGTDYLQIVSWSFVASGIVFVASSMFQALGNTVPPLIASFTRLLLVVVPLLFLSRVEGFDLKWIWYLSAVSVVVQVAMNLLLLQREFRLRLPSAGIPVSSTASVP
jgi:putative MATE family efflux protein